MSINIGDLVRFRAGRGYAKGRVANIVENMATIVSANGKLVNRKVSMLTKLEAAPLESSALPEPCSQTTPTTETV